MTEKLYILLIIFKGDEKSRKNVEIEDYAMRKIEQGTVAVSLDEKTSDGDTGTRKDKVVLERRIPSIYGM